MFFDIRKRLSQRSLGWRFAAWFLVFFVLGSTSCFGLAYYLITTSLQNADATLLRGKANELSLLIKNKSVDLVREHLKQHPIEHSDFVVRLLDEQNNLLLRHIPNELDDFEHSPFPNQVPQRYEQWDTVLGDDDDETLDLLSVQPVAGWILQVGRSSSARDDILENFSDIVLAMSGLLVILGGVLALIFTRRALHPIQDLITTVASITSGNLAARVPVTSQGDELDRLKQLFNTMLDRIQALIEGLQQTTDGLAHDIRTPITRLRSDAELALTGATSPEQLREALINTIENAEQLMRLVDVLMDVCEAESGAMQLHCHSFAVDELFEDVRGLYQFVAEDKAIALDVTPTNLVVSGDFVRIKQAMANLVDNALKYTPTGGRVRLSATQEGGFVTLSVLDTGPGIDPHDQPHIWTRLYRGDKSRSQRGMGLGLSLVKAIADVHKGHVRVVSEPSRGALFQLSLPMDAHYKHVILTQS